MINLAEFGFDEAILERNRITFRKSTSVKRSEIAFDCGVCKVNPHSVEVTVWRTNENDLAKALLVHLRSYAHRSCFEPFGVY